MPEKVLLRRFQCTFFSCSIFLKTGTVYDRPTQGGQAITHGRQTGKNTHIFPPESIQPLKYVHTFLVPCCRSTFSDKFLFLLIQISGGTSQICLHLCLPPFLCLPVSCISQSFSFWAQR